MTHGAPRPAAAQALDAFMARKAEIDALLDRLRAASDDHFGVHPDAVNWGHVGDLGHHAELLRRIADAVLREGECATDA